MNPELPSNPREELELRITALLLGELSDAEAASVRAAIAQDAELQKLHDDLKQTIHLVTEAAASTGESAHEESEPLKLSEARRKSLMTAFIIPPLKPEHVKTDTRFRLRLIEVMVAVAIMVLVASMLLPTLSKSKSRAQSAAVSSNLRQLEAAKQQLALEGKKAPGDVVTFEDLNPYLGRGPAGTAAPVAGEKYILGKVGEPVTAELDGRKLASWDQGRVDTAVDAPTARAAAVLAEREGQRSSEVQVYAKRVEEESGVQRNQVSGQWASDSNGASFEETSKQAQEGLGKLQLRGFYDDNYAANKPASVTTPSDQPKLAPAKQIVLPKSGEGEGKDSLLGLEVAKREFSKSRHEKDKSDLVPLEIKLPAPAFKGTPRDISDLTKSSGPGRPSGSGVVATKPAAGPATPVGGSEVAAVTAPLPPALSDGNLAVVDGPVVNFDLNAAGKFGGGGGASGGGSAFHRLADSKGEHPFGEPAGQAASASAPAEQPAVPAARELSGAISGSGLAFATGETGGPENFGDKFKLNKGLSAEGLTKTGAGTLTISGANTYAGGTVVSAGALSTDGDSERNRPGGAVAQSGGKPSGTEALGVVQDERAPSIPADGTFTDSLRPIKSAPAATATVPAEHGQTVGVIVVNGGSVATSWGKSPAETPMPLDSSGNDKSPSSQLSTGLNKSGTGKTGVTDGTLSVDEKASSGLPAIANSPPPVVANNDAVPVLGDLPFIGRAFRSESRSDGAEISKEQRDVAWRELVYAQKLADQGKFDKTQTKLDASATIASGNTSYDYYRDETKKVIQSKQRIPELEKAGDTSAAREELPVPQLATNAFVGDPKWVGLLEKPSKPLSSDNRFVSRHASIAPTDSESLARGKRESNIILPSTSATPKPSMPRGIVTAGKEGKDSGLQDSSKEMREALRRPDKRQLDEKNTVAEDKLSVERGGLTVTDAPLPRKPATNAPVAQAEVQTSENNFSTFSLNVSDVSFKLAAASLEKGQMPDSASIRSEEFINAFDYRDPEPAVPLLGGDRGGSAPIAFAWERARYPFAHNRDLLRFSLKTAAAGRQAGRPLNVVLLLDNSGSMERADRVSIIREALRVLASQLQPQDKLSVITFARTPRLVADGITGDKAGEVAERVSGLTPEGGTNLEDAMNLAYQTAAKHFLVNGINRVVVFTDGAANLGDVEPESLKQKVETQRQQGIALDCFGIGWEGFNDDLLEVLSRNGDGRYGFINSPEEAASEFAAQLAGALKVAASDVKVQVEWNPQRVTAYRQIGYAKHQLTKEQFRDNTVDAAEIAAQEAGNALYTVEVNPSGAGPLATVHVRYKIPGTTDYREQTWDVPFAGGAVALEQASPAMRLATTASAFSEWLAVNPFAGEVTPDALLQTLSGVPEAFGADSRPKKLEWMIRQAKSLEGK